EGVRCVVAFDQLRSQARSSDGTEEGLGIDHLFGKTDARALHAAVPECRSEEHTSELQSLTNLVCRLLLEKKKHKQCECATLNLYTTAVTSSMSIKHESWRYEMAQRSMNVFSTP